MLNNLVKLLPDLAKFAAGALVALGVVSMDLVNQASELLKAIADALSAG